MLEGQWTILYIEHITSTTCQPTYLYISSICQGQGQYLERMFPTDKEGQQHQHTNTHSSKCLDHYLINSSSTCQNHTHLPWGSTQKYHTTDTHTYTLTTTSMQHHITAFSPATTL